MKILHEEPTSGYRRKCVWDLKPGDVYVNGTHNPERLNQGFALYMLLNEEAPYVTRQTGFRCATNLRNGNLYMHENGMQVWVADAETRFSLIKD